MSRAPKDLAKYAEGLLGFPVAQGARMRLTKTQEGDDTEGELQAGEVGVVHDMEWLAEPQRLSITLGFGGDSKIAFDENHDPEFWFTFKPVVDGEIYARVYLEVRVFDVPMLMDRARKRFLTHTESINQDKALQAIPDDDVSRALLMLLDPGTVPGTGFQILDTDCEIIG